MNPKRPRHVIIKMVTPKKKEKILRAAREKQLVTYKRAPIIRLSTYFSTDIFQTRRNWHAIFKVMKSKDLYPRLLLFSRAII